MQNICKVINKKSFWNQTLKVVLHQIMKLVEFNKNVIQSESEESHKMEILSNWLARQTVNLISS